jgi:hypothetical protein
MERNEAKTKKRNQNNNSKNLEKPKRAKKLNVVCLHRIKAT